MQSATAKGVSSRVAALVAAAAEKKAATEARAIKEPEDAAAAAATEAAPNAKEELERRHAENAAAGESAEAVRQAEMLRRAAVPTTAAEKVAVAAKVEEARMAATEDAAARDRAAAGEASSDVRAPQHSGEVEARAAVVCANQEEQITALISASNRRGEEMGKKAVAQRESELAARDAAFDSQLAALSTECDATAAALSAMRALAARKEETRKARASTRSELIAAAKERAKKAAVDEAAARAAAAAKSAAAAAAATRAAEVEVAAREAAEAAEANKLAEAVAAAEAAATAVTTVGAATAAAIAEVTATSATAVGASLISPFTSREHTTLPPCLVITADDLGISKPRTVGIISAMVDGCVSHASVMANGPVAAEAIVLAREAGVIDRVGLHVNLTEGRPLARAADVKSLLLPRGITQPGTRMTGPGPLFRGKFGLKVCEILSQFVCYMCRGGSLVLSLRRTVCTVRCSLSAQQ